ncbi:lipopolysaccharide biosynthesis protein [Cohnella suwonensis]|uniref:Lipopolysaccharide biosynthesis protein n=1 Tax=Cohnella suwonensis TaxID=696072 RepID=A0ABW0LV73_9BACL
MTQLAAIRRAWRGNGLAHTIFRTSATNFLVMVVVTLTSIVTARMYGVEGKGELSAIVFWPTLLAGLVGFGLPTSLIYNLKQSVGGGEAFVRASFLFQAPVSVITGAVAWFGLPYWLGGYPAHIAAIARGYTVAMVPVLLAINLVSALAQSKGRFAVYNGVRLFVPLCNLAGLIGLWAVGNLSLGYSALMFAATSVLVVAWAMVSLADDIRFGRFGGIRDLKAAWPLFAYGSKVFGVELLGALYSQFDKLVILSMLTARDLGLYTVVFALSRVYNVVQTAIANVVFPKVTGMAQERILATVGRAFRLSLLLMTAVVVPTMFIGRFLMGVLFGEPFLEASTAFYLLCFECIIGGGSWILASSFNAMGRPGLVLLRQTIALAITVVLLIWLTPVYGLNGIAAGLLIGAVVRLALTLASMKIVFRVPLRGMLFDRNDFRYLAERLKEKKR